MKSNLLFLELNLKEIKFYYHNKVILKLFIYFNVNRNLLSLLTICAIIANSPLFFRVRYLSTILTNVTSRKYLFSKISTFVHFLSKKNAHKHYLIFLIILLYFLYTVKLASSTNIYCVSTYFKS